MPRIFASRLTLIRLRLFCLCVAQQCDGSPSDQREEHDTRKSRLPLLPTFPLRGALLPICAESFPTGKPHQFEMRGSRVFFSRDRLTSASCFADLLCRTCFSESTHSRALEVNFPLAAGSSAGVT